MDVSCDILLVLRAEEQALALLFTSLEIAIEQFLHPVWLFKITDVCKHRHVYSSHCLNPHCVSQDDATLCPNL